jgi:hypothetical protein
MLAKEKGFSDYIKIKELQSLDLNDALIFVG